MYSPSYGNSSYGSGGPSYGGGGGQKQVRALYDYVGEQPSDLSFRTGDVITVVSENSPSGPEWWEGSLNGRTGSFPHNHVEVTSGGSPRGGYGGSSPSFSSPSKSGGAFSPLKRLTQAFSSLSPTSSAPSEPTPTGGGGGSFVGSEKKGKAMFGLYIICLIFTIVGLIIPWYTNTNDGRRLSVWQWTGRAEWDLRDVNSFFPFPNNGAGFRSYANLRYTGIEGVLVTTMVFMLAASLVNIPVIVWSRRLYIGELDGLRRLAIGSGIMTAFLMVGFFQFFRFSSGYKEDVDPGCTTGLCSSFSGSAGTVTWGPTFGWVISLVAIFIAMINHVLLFLVYRDG